MLVLSSCRQSLLATAGTMHLWTWLQVVGILNAWSSSTAAVTLPLLRAAEFRPLVTSGEHVWFVHFFDERSKKSQLLFPMWQAVAQQLNGVVKVASVDCRTEQESALQYNLSWASICDNAPALEAYVPNSAGAVKRRSYLGQHTVKAMVQFAGELFPPELVTILSSSKRAQRGSNKTTVDDFLRSSPLAKALFFTPKKSPPGFVKSLSLFFKGRLQVAAVPPGESEIRRRFGNLSPPAVLVLKPGPNGLVQHRGAFSRGEIEEFLLQHAKRDQWSTSKKTSVPEADSPKVRVHIPRERSGSGPRTASSSEL
mmetsp:Transcript_35643/g.83386  ORF Transcript_35643/g.83386 Transcript_35643/m.83386 type:complete len:311 (+) Transcript_35643:145-1077(+)